MDRAISDKRSAAGLGHAGVWMFYAGGLVLSFSQMGPLGSAAFLTAFALGRIWGPRPSPATSDVPQGESGLTSRDTIRGLSLLGAGGMGLLSLQPGIVIVIALSVLVGVASRVSGTPDPWITIGERDAKRDTTGWSGTAGALLGAVLIAAGRGDPSSCLAGSAILFGASVLMGRGTTKTEPTSWPRGLAGASVGTWTCLAVVGFRVLEPGLLTDVSSAVFFIPAWALGVKGAHAWAFRVDDRAIAAAPFGAGAALAALGVVTGPGLVFLYAALSFLVSLTLTSQSSDLRDRPRSHALAAAQVLVALSGSAVGVAGLTDGFSSAVWALGSVVIAGGFVDLALPRRPKGATSTGVSLPPAEPPRSAVLADRLPQAAKGPAPYFDLRKRPDRVPAKPHAGGPSPGEPPPGEPQVTGPLPPAAPDTDRTRDAAAILLEAMKQARAIRSEGLAQLAQARKPGHGARERALQAIDEMLDALGTQG